MNTYPIDVTNDDPTPPPPSSSSSCPNGFSEPGPSLLSSASLLAQTPILLIDPQTGDCRIQGLYPEPLVFIKSGTDFIAESFVPETLSKDDCGDTLLLSSADR